jgi:hypothetical protein
MMSDGVFFSLNGKLHMRRAGNFLWDSLKVSVAQGKFAIQRFFPLNGKLALTTGVR